MTYTIHDKGLSTMIDWKNKDIHGRDISAGRRAQIYRMRKWHKRIKVADAKDRNLAFALTELDRLSLTCTYQGILGKVQQWFIEKQWIRDLLEVD